MITIEQSGAHGLILFGRDVNGKRIVQNIKDFMPYFFIDNLDGMDKSIYQEPIKKIVLKASADVLVEKRKYSKTYESDIKFTQRYLIDKVQVPIPKEEIRRCYMDIETDDSVDVAHAPAPITCITCYDSFLKKYVTMTWKSDNDIKEIKEKDKSRYYFKDEISMMKKVIEFIKSTDPDMFLNWNVNYDVGYFLNRCRILGLQPNSISPMNYTRIDQWGVRVYGRVVFDMLKGFLKNFKKGTPSDLTLNTIAGIVLNKQKIENEMTPGQLWRQDYEHLIEYNIHDVELVVEIDEKLHMVDFYDQRRRDTGSLWDRITAVSYVNGIELLREAHTRGLAIPTGLIKRDDESAEGATIEVNPGIYEWTLEEDVKGDYPRWLVSCNMSPETVSRDGDIILGNGVRFLSHPIGIVAAVVARQIARRDNSKKQRDEYVYGTREYETYDLIQYSNKVLCNSWYGLLNSPSFLIYEKKITDSITWGGRVLLEWTRDILRKEGYEAIYMHTDGIKISLGHLPGTFEENRDFAIAKGKELQKKINLSYKEFAQQYNIKNVIFEIDMGKIFEGIIIGAKARNAGWLVYDDNKKVEKQLDVTGFEIIRADSAKVEKEVQRKLFEMILPPNSSTKEEVLTYVAQVKKDLMSNKYKLEEIGFPKPWKQEEYKKPPWHVEAAMWSNANLGTKFKTGSRFFVVAVKQVPGFLTPKRIGFDKNTKIPVGTMIDWDNQMPPLLDNKLETLFDVLGWNKKPKMRGLNSYDGV